MKTSLLRDVFMSESLILKHLEPMGYMRPQVLTMALDLLLQPSLMLQEHLCI